MDRVAEVVFAHSRKKIKNIEEIRNNKEQLLELARETWKKFAVSGSYDFKTGKAKESTDVDGKSSLGLFKLAGFDTADTKYLLASEPEEGRIHVDMGEKDGFIVKDDGKTAFIDHHSPDSKRGSSATEHVYKTLLAMGALAKSPALDRLVSFVNAEDNRSYKKEKEYFPDTYRTVLGLSRFMTFEQLQQYFETHDSADELLSKAEIKKLGLEKQSEKLEKSIVKSQERLRELERDGFIVKSPRYGKIVVDVERSVPEAFRAAKAYGAGAYLIWSPRNKSIFFSSVDTPITDKLPQGKLIRETMWIKPPSDKSQLKMNLREILNVLTDRTLRPIGKLEQYLAKA